MKRGWMVVVLVLVSASAALAQTPAAGRDLYRYWQAYERVQKSRTPGTADLAASGLYMGYVQGVCDTFTDIDGLSGVNTSFDIPSTIPTTRVYTAVGRYLDDHPELLGSPATWLVMQALEIAFPRAPG